MVINLNDDDDNNVNDVENSNGHNKAKFEAITSRLFMVTDLDDIYKMMMTMIMIRMIKTQYGHDEKSKTSITSTA